MGSFWKILLKQWEFWVLQTFQPMTGVDLGAMPWQGGGGGEGEVP